MKKRFVPTVIFLLVLCVTLAACNVSLLGDVQLPNHEQTTFKLYVSGAVARDGYYEVEAGTSYLELFQLAGILSQTQLPLFYANLVDGSVTCFILDYNVDGVVYNSVNVNGELIRNRRQIKGLSADVVNKLADYLEQHGTIRNRQQLSVALGEDYADNYYKLHVAEDDYEEAD